MKKPPDTTLAISADYRQFVEELKSRVTSARISAARRINYDMIFLYWDIGRGIVEKQKTLGWGESVVEMVAAELQRAFPMMGGFSPRNVRDMKRFYLAYCDEGIWRQPVAKMVKGGKNPGIWPQAVAKLDTDDTPTPIQRQAVTKLGGTEIWPQLVAKSEDGNSGQSLPQLVAEIPWGHHRFILDKLSDPAARLWYLRATARFGWSRNVLLNQIKAGAYERAVTEKKTHNFDLALPKHFAEQADEMLKSIFYLNLLNDKERGPDDQPSIGIILCAEKDDVEVEYALRTKTNLIGVAAYALQSKLPGELKGKLPTAKQLSDIVRAEMEGEK